MEWNTILNDLLLWALIALAGWISKSLIALWRENKQALRDSIQNEKIKAYFDMLDKAVERSVRATNQKYVEALKRNREDGVNLFTFEAQKQAFAMSYQATLDSLTHDAKAFLEGAVIDLQALVDAMIHEEVNLQKGLLHETDKKAVEEALLAAIQKSRQA